jgi:tRNA-Thr(GGU) m(6)t(6)A37 methyltransferase TsaA
VRYRPIGVVHSPFKKPGEVPKHVEEIIGTKGSVEVAREYVDGLKDIEGLSYIILIYHFHLAEGYSLIAKPCWDENLHGVFCTRLSSRPNPIGMSIVRLTKREDNMLFIQDLDMVEGTPLLDIKPYVPDLDQRETARTRGSDWGYQ